VESEALVTVPQDDESTVDDSLRRAECMARIQSDAVELTLDLLAREANVDGFFRAFVRTLVQECESEVCGVWLLDDGGKRCDLWMVQMRDRLVNSASPDWPSLDSPREAMAAFLLADDPGRLTTIEYTGDDARLPDAVRAFNREQHLDSIIVGPLVLAGRTLGWIALGSTACTACESLWRKAVVEAIARQGTVALHQSRVAERARLEERRQAVLEERNRIARDIHDTLAQGFGAILMQLQAAQRSAGGTDTPPVVARTLDTAIDLARRHLIEARRSVSALRPQSAEPEDLRRTLERLVDLTRRASEVPIDLRIDDLPNFGGGVERDIAAIAQEAITNAVRHARARRISVHASATRAVGFRLSVADDGRGIAKERRGDGFGMTSMQERADRIGASLTIVTAPRAGTEVVLAWEPPQFSIPRNVAHAD
jgi:signal transduction histidine kinase